MNISVCIASYGSEEWERIARDRALPSAEAQEPAEILIGHQTNGTVSTSRNGLAERATGDWLCFLDADDELAPGYLEAMRRTGERLPAGPDRLLTPAVSMVVKGRPQVPRMLPQVDYWLGNDLIIGTLLPTALFHRVGGFADEPRYGAWEDWHFWARCEMAGAEVVQVKRAVYLRHFDQASRMHSASPRERDRWHYEVGRDLFPEHYPVGWLNRRSRPMPRRKTRTRR